MGHGSTILGGYQISKGEMPPKNSSHYTKGKILRQGFAGSYSQIAFNPILRYCSRSYSLEEEQTKGGNPFLKVGLIEGSP